MEVWNGGAFSGSYCELHAAVSRAVMCARPCQEPQILMMGAPDPDFPLEPAFHRVRNRNPVRGTRSYR